MSETSPDTIPALPDPVNAMSSKVRVYASVIVSVMITLAFTGTLYILIFHVLPQGSEPLINVLVGTLAALQTQVANYWLGSSAGSAAKDMKKS